MSEELKPCPFCGHRKILQTSGDGYSVSCMKCGSHGSKKMYCESMLDAITAWNTRPIEDEKDRDIVRLKNRVEKLELFLFKIQEISIPHIGSLAFFQAEMKTINRWCKVALGKDNDVPANDTDNNVGSITEINRKERK